MSASDNYIVEKGGAACHRCCTEFGGGQTYFSALIEREEGFAREDYCRGCWEKREAGDCFSFWKTRRRKDERHPRINSEVVFEFFHKLQDSERQDRREMRFVLALYLARRKALKFQSVTRDGGRDMLVFARPKHDETYLVEDPQLSEEQISAATERLKELFHEEL